MWYSNDGIHSDTRQVSYFSITLASNGAQNSIGTWNGRCKAGNTHKD